MYTLWMRFTWDEAKRAANLRKHGLDFVDAPEVFDGPTCTVEDSRLAYGEQRLMSLGFLRGLCVSIIHTETARRGGDPAPWPEAGPSQGFGVPAD
jgi:hypothetical protein